MRWSKAFVPTLKENPADAEIVSHQLMVRSGMLRKVAAGVFDYLPLGTRCNAKVARIVREEMDRIDGQEIVMPVLQPSELWVESGRWGAFGKELMRLRDRHERDFALGPTHEEIVTALARNVLRSYRQLPCTLYQIQVKFRDEIRPRFGVMRAREFLMKDAYSFHADDASLDVVYRAMRGAYERILERLGLDFRVVEADTGVIGGSESHEFMVLAANGESEILSCETCDYAANAERAETVLQPWSGDAAPARYESVPTPGKRTIEEVSGFLKVRPEALTKTLLFKVDGQDVAALVPGDRDLNEAKFARLAGSGLFRPLEAEEVRQVTSAEVGFAGPVGLPASVRILADASLKSRASLIVGANRTDEHLRGVVAGRDFSAHAWGDLVQARAGDRCPRCNGALVSSRGIEVGHIFKLGTKYSIAMAGTFLDESGAEKPYVMGCYGFGVTRTVAAAIEQHHDADGIRWPRSLAPFDVIVLPVALGNPTCMEVAEDLYAKLRAAGVDVLLDDRDLRPGAKFKDADLIGIPIRVTIGERGLQEDKLEIRDRASGEVTTAPRAGIFDAVRAAV
jgi:prolyl-tRNA synthetase